MEPTPETRYAQTADGGQVAYQVAGSGPTLTLGFLPFAVIDLMWEEPSLVRFLDRLSSFTRHAWFDPRGSGSSGSLPSGEVRTVESVTDDLLAVLDAIGEERCILLGLPAHPALVFAATHPARTAALALLEPTARVRSDGGYAGPDNDQVERMLARLEREWGTGVVGRLFWWGGDDRVQRWYAKCERLMYSPREGARVLRSVLDTDVRRILLSTHRRRHVRGARAMGKRPTRTESCLSRRVRALRIVEDQPLQSSRCDRRPRSATPLRY